MSFSKTVKDELKKKDFTAYEKAIKIYNSESKNRIIRNKIRSAFINSGSITDPNKDYHLEFVCETEAQAASIQTDLHTFGLDAKCMERGRHYVAYLKDASQISDVLNLMGAVDALMEFENVRILKEVSEKVNRRVNCETANIQRTVSAGIRQVEDIELIARIKGLDSLDPGLREIAELRLHDPNASLQELAENLSEPIGKSGANHRMRKLSQMAAALRKNIEG